MYPNYEFVVCITHNTRHVFSIFWQAYDLFKDGKMLEMVDPFLMSSPDMIEEQVFNCIKIALLCVQEEPRQRPSMNEVVMMLEGQNQIQSHVEREIGVPGTYLYKGLLSSFHSHILHFMLCINTLTLSSNF